MIQDIELSAGPGQAKGAGCACCTGEATNRSASVTDLDQAAVQATEGKAMATITAYQVEGMTCGHCVAAVSGELQSLPGVVRVEVELVPGAASTVTVTSAAPLAEVDVRAAVEEAGYTLAGPGGPS